MTKPVHIIVLDDDKEICRLLKDFLSKHSYQVSVLYNPTQLFTMLNTEPKADLLILDLMLPEISGIEVCKRLRQEAINIPIIMLTAMTDDMEKILGLEIGADDYLTKPFNPRELLARIKAIQRRISVSIDNGVNVSPNLKGHVLKFEGWTLNTASRQLFSADNIEVGLSSRNFDLLLLFLENPQRVLSRDQLLTTMNNRTVEAFDRTIDVQISRLRQKLGDDPKEPKLLKTVRNGGYLFTANVKRY